MVCCPPSQTDLVELVSDGVKLAVVVTRNVLNLKASHAQVAVEAGARVLGFVTIRQRLARLDALAERLYLQELGSDVPQGVVLKC